METDHITIEEKLQTLVKIIDQRERVIRRRTTIITLLPLSIFLVLIFLSMSTYQMSSAPEVSHFNQELVQARNQLSTATAYVKKLDQQVTKLQTQVVEQTVSLSEMNRKLDDLINLGRHTFLGDVLISSRHISQTHPKQTEILEDIIQMREKGVGFKEGGFSPETGFDSPSFVAYLLEKHDLLKITNPSQRYNLMNLLQKIEQPLIGDIVFYDSDYTMFFFQDEQKNPFVIGMTPIGILALEYNFANIRGFGNVSYPSTINTEGGSSGGGGGSNGENKTP